MSRITLDDMRSALRGQHRAEEAIFWFCNAWHSGALSDLYQILRKCTYTPTFHKLAAEAKRISAENPIKDSDELKYCFQVLGALYERTFGHAPVEYRLQPIRMDDVQEDDVVIHAKWPMPDPVLGRHVQEFPCIQAGWPCRVYKHHGQLGVACVEGPDGANFHPLEADKNGFVRGFWR